MGKSNRIITLTSIVGVLASIIGGVAASANATINHTVSTTVTHPENIAPIGWHMTTPLQAKTAAQKSIDSYLTKIKASGDWVTNSDVVLVNGGWKGEIYYSGPKLLRSDISSTKGKDLPQLFGYHQVTGLKTKTDADAHLKWSLNQLASHPNDKQLVAGLTTVQSNNKGVKTYGYIVDYFTSGTKLFNEDTVIPYVEHDNNAGASSD